LSTELLGQILIVLIVLVTIILFIFEKFEKIKIALTSSIFSLLIFYFLIFRNSEEYLGKTFFGATFEFINIEAILIIFSISIIVSLTKRVGFFDLISLYLVKLTKGDPKKLFMVLGGITFFISMFFDNLSAIILLGSLTVVICKQIEVNPVPFILFVGVNTVIGGLPTPVSSIPNIIYASDFQKINFIKFMMLILPLAIFFFGIATAYFFLVFKKDLLKKVSKEKKEQIERINPWSGIKNKQDILKSIGLLVFLFGGFLLTSWDKFTVDVAFFALISAVIGLFLFRTQFREMIEEGIEWEMIVFFIALFILMGVLQASGALNPITSLLRSILGENAEPVRQIIVVAIIGSIGFIIMGVINVIPAAVVFSSIYHSLSITSIGLWFSFLLTGNIAGAFIPISSATILMAIEILKTEKYKVDFKKYMKNILPLILILQVLAMAFSLILVYFPPKI